MIRPLSNVRGALHQIDAIKALSTDPCNVRVLSDRVLYILQNLASNEVLYDSRYGEVLPNNLYRQTDPLSADGAIVESLQSELAQQLMENDMLLEKLDCICQAITDLATASGAYAGSEPDAEPGTYPPIGPGEDFESEGQYNTYKCEASNWLIDRFITTFNQLAVYDVDTWTQSTVTVLSGLIGGILSTFFLVGTGPLVAGYIIGLVRDLISGSGSFDFGDMKDAFAANHANLVCAVYEGVDAQSSRDNLLAAATSAGLSNVERDILELMLLYGMLNKLFEYDATIDGYPITSSCAGCSDPAGFQFLADGGTGTFRYDGTEFELSSSPFTTFHRIHFQVPNSIAVAGNWCLEWTFSNIHTGGPGNWNRTFYNYDTSAFDLSPVTSLPDNFPSLNTPVLLSLVQMNAINPFVVRAKIKPGFRGLGNGTAPYSGSNGCS